MSITDEIHRLSIDLSEVCGTLNSISPRLEMHARLTIRKREIQAKIASLEEKRPPIRLSKASQKVRARRSASKKLYETKV